MTKSDGTVSFLMTPLNKCTLNLFSSSPKPLPLSISLPPSPTLLTDTQFSIYFHTHKFQIHDCWHKIGPKCCPEISSHFHSSFIHSISFSYFILISLQKYPFPSPSSSISADELEFHFNKKTEAIRGEFPLAPTTASTAYLHLFPSNLPSLLGELSVLLSKAKTSICALGTISSHLLKDLTPILFWVIKISLHTGSFPSTHRTCYNASHLKKQNNLTSRPSSTTTLFLCWLL